MAERSVHHWAGSLLQHVGLLAVSGGLATLGYQLFLWWLDGAWIPLDFGWLWYRFATGVPDLGWSGEQQAILWLLDRPLSAVLLGAGLTAVGFGRVIASE
jgi:hypothetical protein